MQPTSTSTKELIASQPRPARSVLLDKGDPEAKRDEIRRYFNETWEVYERLFAPLSEEAYTRRADPLRHPLIFYYGHTATFFVNKLVLGKLLDKRINPKFESMFAVGVDEMSWDDLNEAHYDWPAVAEVKAYRDQARATIDSLIQEMPLSLPVDWDSPFWIIMMGIEHERIHLETSSVLIRQLPLDLLKEDAGWPVCPEAGSAPENNLLNVAGGTVRQGKPRGHALYGWDNEYGVCEEEIQGFKASRFLVSNGEFLTFVQDGGYREEQYWTDEGWSWRNYRGAEHPLFWVNTAGGWKLRTMLREIDMPWNWPVEVNYLEAKAFCNWLSERTGKSLRLPTEAEWHRLLEQTETPDQPDWEDAPGNISLEHWASSCPVDRFAFGGGFHDVLGNVWQWTETPISGFPGFAVHPLYDDFSTPTFDTKHNIIKGGSWISTGNEATLHSRYAFRRHFFQHAGFRYVETHAPVVIPDDNYETDPEIVIACELHYGQERFGIDNYPEKIAQIALDAVRGRKRRRALNIGCGAGRTTFELAVEFERVTGMDFTARKFQFADKLREQGHAHYQLPKEGEIVTFHEVRLRELGLENSREKVEFVQGDISNLKPLYKGYDLILVDNLLDKAADPAAFLSEVHERVNHGGLLIIATANEWSEAFTRKDKWLGGYKDAGENVTTEATLARLLSPHFNAVGEPRDVPLVLHKSERSCTIKTPALSVWERV